MADEHDPIPFPDKKPEPVVEPVVEDAPPTAAQRLRAYEDDLLGKDVTRISGHVERGHGSLFSRLTPEQRAHHTALEHLVKAEKKLADASSDLAKAEIEHQAAVKAVDQAESHVDAEHE